MHALEENLVEDKPQIFVGRQPIFDSKLNVAGYELLFRSGNTNAYDGTDGDKATSLVINNALMEIGLDDIIGENPAFINFTKELLIKGVVELLPAERVVVEILEDVEVDSELVASVKKLVDAGYKIALDDFTFSDEWMPLIEIAHIIKFDVMQHSVDEIRNQIKKFSGRKIQLLAEKVETKDEYELLKEEGFEFFQGYFFSKPDLLSHKALSAGSISLLQLVAQIQKPDIETNELEKLISQDASLSYKLFRCVNSAAFGLKSNMTSVKQAVVYLGLQRLKNWVTLLALASNSDKPVELIHTGLIRAKMCELIAHEIDAEEKDAFFVVGLFSILDAILDQPLVTILKKMPLDESINNALLKKEGEMGRALLCSINFEKCNWDEINYPDLSIETLNSIYRDAMSWSQQSLSEII
jgi:EAL and modified HD-GYP domain-containing signal transduction protein